MDFSEKRSKIIMPPEEWKQLAVEYGIKGLFLVINGKNSCRFDKNIYLNINKARWKYYCAIMDVRSYEEAMTCKLLHEIAHVLLGHSDLSFKDEPRDVEYDYEIAIERVAFQKIIEDRQEHEAWKYVFEFRSRHPTGYIRLVEAFRKWCRESAVSSSS